jgi:hypothetical protein
MASKECGPAPNEGPRLSQLSPPRTVRGSALRLAGEMQDVR